MQLGVGQVLPGSRGALEGLADQRERRGVLPACRVRHGEHPEMMRLPDLRAALTETADDGLELRARVRLAGGRARVDR